MAFRFIISIYRSSIYSFTCFVCLSIHSPIFWSFHPSIQISICHFICPFTDPFTHPLIYPVINISLRLFTYQSAKPPTYLLIPLPIHHSIYPSTGLSKHVSLHSLLFLTIYWSIHSLLCQPHKTASNSSIHLSIHPPTYLSIQPPTYRPQNRQENVSLPFTFQNASCMTRQTDKQTEHNSSHSYIWLSAALEPH